MELKLVKSGHKKPCAYTELAFDIGSMGYDWLADCCDELSIDYSGMNLDGMRAAILAKSFATDEVIEVEKLHLDAVALYAIETQASNNPGNANENRKVVESDDMQKDFSRNNQRSKVILEWGGALTGLLGTFLLALNNEYSGYGWIAYLFSNLFWIAFGLRIKAWGLIAMQVGYTALSVFGIYRWLF